MIMEDDESSKATATNLAAVFDGCLLQDDETGACTVDSQVKVNSSPFFKVSMMLTDHSRLHSGNDG